MESVRLGNNPQLPYLFRPEKQNELAVENVAFQDGVVAEGARVSDPVPLEDLALGLGSYSLHAAPARGASVTLSYTLEESKE